MSQSAIETSGSSLAAPDASPLRSIAKLFVGSVLARAISVVIVVAIARRIGPIGYGTLGLGVAYASIGAYFTDLGLTHTQIREGTRPGVDQSALLKTSLVLRLLLAIPASVGAWLFIASRGSSAQTSLALTSIVLVTIWARALQGFATAYLYTIHKTELNAYLDIAANAITALLVFAVLRSGASIVILCLVYNASLLVTAVIAAGVVISRHGALAGWNWRILDDIGAFAIGGLLTLFVPQIGVVVIDHLGTTREVGVFAAASRVPASLYMIPSLLATSLFSRLFYYSARDRQKYQSLADRQLKFMLLAGVAMALPFALHASFVVSAVLGNKWGPDAARTLAVLAWLVALQSISAPLADGLTTQGRQSRRTLAQGISLPVTITAYWSLTVRFGAVGAALGALIGEAAQIGCLLAANPRRYHLMRRMGAAMLIAGGAASVVLLVRWAWGSNLTSFILALPCYAVCVFLLDVDTRAQAIRALGTDVSARLRRRIVGAA